MHRLYIDEVGNPNFRPSSDPNQRYLSLTGVILDSEYVRLEAHPKLEELKARFFGSHPDEPIVLHRKELNQRNYPFQALREDVLRALFLEDFCSYLEDLQFSVVTAIIDKEEHQERYTVWRYEPYHYCMAVVIERYVIWLRKRRLTGDVVVEARGRHDDQRLARSFKGIYERGTNYMTAKIAGEALTSNSLKLKTKGANVTGLQIADMIANPIFRSELSSRDSTVSTDYYTRMVMPIVAKKYDDGPNGEPWGVKWLP